MSDIVETLRQGLYCPERGRHEPDYMLEEAADTITTLRAEVERMRRALERIAKGQGDPVAVAVSALAQEKPNDR